MVFADGSHLETDMVVFSPASARDEAGPPVRAGRGRAAAWW